MAVRLPPGVIVNADDLGIHPQTNNGILSAYLGGIVSSATLLVTAPHFTHAVEEVIRPSGLPTGLHFNLTQGRCICRPGELNALVDETGTFRLTAGALVRLSRRSLMDGLASQIRAELAAQLALAKDWGISLTHIDSHQHIHMNPGIFDLVQETASYYGVSRIRFSREPFIPRLFWRGFRSAWRRRNHLKWMVLRYQSAKIHNRLQTTDLFFGLTQSGAMTRELLMGIINWASPARSMEISLHPGFQAPVGEVGAPDSRYDRFSSSPLRQAEFEAVTDAEIMDVVGRRGLTLMSFAGIPKSVR